jgi:hypothetical protein
MLLCSARGWAGSLTTARDLSTSFVQPHPLPCREKRRSARWRLPDHRVAHAGLRLAPACAAGRLRRPSLTAEAHTSDGGGACAGLFRPLEHLKRRFAVCRRRREGGGPRLDDPLHGRRDQPSYLHQTKVDACCGLDISVRGYGTSAGALHAPLGDPIRARDLSRFRARYSRRPCSSGLGPCRRSSWTKSGGSRSALRDRSAPPEAGKPPMVKAPQTDLSPSQIRLDAGRSEQAIGDALADLMIGKWEYLASWPNDRA